MKNLKSTKEKQEKYKDEQVFIIPFSKTIHIKDKFTPIEKTTDIKIYDSLGKFIFRYDAEENNNFQQLIAYVVIRNKKDKDKFYVSKRIGCSEDRLLNKMSIGFGGHINPCDKMPNIIVNSAYRELEEELDTKIDSELKLIGYVRDILGKTNDHLGFVFMTEVDDCSIKEKDNLEGSWMTTKELEEQFFHFESWGQFIIDYLVENINKI